MAGALPDSTTATLTPPTWLPFCLLLLCLVLLQQHVSGTDLDKVYFSNFRKLDIKGIPCFLTRTG